MKPAVDLTGRKFGRLKVIGRAETTHELAYSIRRPSWVCECECGNIVTVIGANLREGKTKSCGCLRKETSAANAKKAREAMKNDRA